MKTIKARDAFERFDGGCATIKAEQPSMPLFEKLGGNNCKGYDDEHPQIWLDFERIALEQIGKGYKHLGAKAIFEIIRFNSPASEEFPKLNNNMTFYYSRKFAEKYPQYKEFFEFRVIKK